MKVGEQFEADYQRNNPMNQPIQENKEECKCEEMSCKAGCTERHTCHVFWCEKCHPERYQETQDEIQEDTTLMEEKLEALTTPQNTSREEIRERWRKYVASEVEVSPTKLLIWWLAEIEAAEKRGYENGYFAGGGKLVTSERKYYSAGQQAERERVQEELEGLRQERDELRDELYKIHH